VSTIAIAITTAEVVAPAFVAEATASTTATAEATASATTTAWTTAAATASRASLFGNVHANGATVEGLAIHLCHGRLGRVRLGERHEAEATRASRLSVGDHFGLHDLTKGRECIPKPSIVRVPAEATDKQLVRHRLVLFFLSWRWAPAHRIPRVRGRDANMPQRPSIGVPGGSTPTSGETARPRQHTV
jgi:hypothetical protein